MKSGGNKRLYLTFRETKTLKIGSSLNKITNGTGDTTKVTAVASRGAADKNRHRESSKILASPKMPINEQKI